MGPPLWSRRARLGAAAAHFGHHRMAGPRSLVTVEGTTWLPHFACHLCTGCAPIVDLSSANAGEPPRWSVWADVRLWPVRDDHVPIRTAAAQRIPGIES
jgi:hypothetical protein